jgi:hypothetical protein
VLEVLAILRNCPRQLEMFFEIISCDYFTFIVNDARVESTVAEAFSISPAIFDILRHDRSTLPFVISGPDLESSNFKFILEFVRSNANANASPRSDRNANANESSNANLSDGHTLSLLSVCHL